MRFLVAMVFVGFVSPLFAQVVDLELGGFQVVKEVVVPVPPEEAYDAMTGDVSAWWDHSFSGDPFKLFIEAVPGGGFFEIFDDSGDGVKHAEVIYCHRGKALRLRGPLGLSGNAIDFVHDFKFEAEGDGTKIRLTVNGAGQIEEGWSDAVDRVWDHFLIEQFKPYVEAGTHRDR